MKNSIKDMVLNYLYMESISKKDEVSYYFNEIYNKKKKYYTINKDRILSRVKGSGSKLDEVMKFDCSFNDRGMITGTDEVGRGCIFGPVIAVTVMYNKIFPGEDPVFQFVNDSKKLDKRKRELIFFSALKADLDFSIGFSTVDYIERYNILNATVNAMRMSLKKYIKADSVNLIDGRFPIGIFDNSIMVIKGDCRSFAIGLASIMAKSIRDLLMTALSKIYPDYMIENNMGYGTVQHFKKIDENGYTELHRESFLKKHFQKQRQRMLI